MRGVDFHKQDSCLKIKYNNNFPPKTSTLYINVSTISLLCLHLFVISARRAFSDAKVSSKSKSSRGGGGNSLKAGGKTLKWRISTVYCHIFLLHFTDLYCGLRLDLKKPFIKSKAIPRPKVQRCTFLKAPFVFCKKITEYSKRVQPQVCQNYHLASQLDILHLQFVFSFAPRDPGDSWGTKLAITAHLGNIFTLILGRVFSFSCSWICVFNG